MTAIWDLILKGGAALLGVVLSFWGKRKDDAGRTAQKLDDIQASGKEQEKVNAVPYADDAAVDDSLRDGSF